MHTRALIAARLEFNQSAIFRFDMYHLIFFDTAG